MIAAIRFWLLAGLIVFTGLGALRVAFEGVPAFEALVPDGYKIYWIMAIFLLAPFGMATAAALAVPRASRGGGRRRLYDGASFLLVLACWAYVFQPAMFWTSFFIHALEPWPLSLRQGPDTARAREGFRSWAGFEPPDTVTAIYFRSMYGFGEGSEFLRFTYFDEGVIERAARSAGLVPVPAEARGYPGDRRLVVHDPIAGWWDVDDINSATIVYWHQFRSWETILWVNEHSGTAYFRYRGS